MARYRYNKLSLVYPRRGDWCATTRSLELIKCRPHLLRNDHADTNSRIRPPLCVIHPHTHLGDDRVMETQIRSLRRTPGLTCVNALPKILHESVHQAHHYQLWPKVQGDSGLILYKDWILPNAIGDAVFGNFLVLMILYITQDPEYVRIYWIAPYLTWGHIAAVTTGGRLRRWQLRRGSRCDGFTYSHTRIQNQNKAWAKKSLLPCFLTILQSH